MTEQDLHRLSIKNPDEIRQIETLNQIKNNINAPLKEMSKLIKKPYLESRQIPIENRFRGTVGRLAGIGIIELNLQIPEMPDYYRYKGIWLCNRDQALDKGYLVKSYEEYLAELAKKAKSIGLISSL